MGEWAAQEGKDEVCKKITCSVATEHVVLTEACNAARGMILKYIVEHFRSRQHEATFPDDGERFSDGRVDQDVPQFVIGDGDIRVAIKIRLLAVRVSEAGIVIFLGDHLLSVRIASD